MKVLMLSSDKLILDPTSSVATRMKEYGSLCNHLEILILGAKKYEKVALDSRVTARAIPGKNVHLFWKIPWRLRKHHLDFDFVTAQDPFEIGLLGYVISRYFKKPLEVQLHTDIFSPHFKKGLKNRVRFWIAYFLMKKVKTIRIVTGRIENELVNRWGVPKQKIVVLPIIRNDLASFSSHISQSDIRAKYPSFETIVLMLTRFAPEKNIPLALQAFSKISIPHVGLLLVGDGEEKSIIEKTIHSLGLTTKVAFEPWTNTPQDMYQSADIFLLSSNFEGYGMTLVEAAASGLPIVSTNVGLMGDILTKDEALISPVGDAVSLAKNLEKVITDVPFRHALGKKAQEKVLKVMDQERYLEEYQKMWERNIA